ncbi:MAG: hypothetical protein ACJARD_000183 [Alphaproteobacteria bacterium]|jgi:uncharacterized protein (DUF983 family)
MSDTRTHKNILHVLYCAVLFKCPLCHKGKLFKKYLKLNTHCSECNQSFAKADTGDGPAFFVMSLVSIIAVVILLIVELSYSPAMWIHLLIQFFVITGLSFVLLPIIKSILIHLQYYFNAIESFQNKS